MRFGLIFSLIIALLAVVFALQNPQMMDVNLFFIQTEGSTALVLIITFIFGVIVGILSSLPSRLRDRRKLRELKKKETGTSSSASSRKSSSPSSTSTE